MATGINILAFRELFLEIDKTCDNDFFCIKDRWAFIKRCIRILY